MLVEQIVVCIYSRSHFMGLVGYMFSLPALPGRDGREIAKLRVASIQ